MKKLIMCFAGAMMALSLAACSPTKVGETPKAESNPAGLTPEMVKESHEVVEKIGEIGAPEFEMAFIYSVNAAGDGIVRTTKDVEFLDEETIVEELIANGVLEEGTKVEGLEISGEEKAGPGVETAAAVSEEEAEDRIGILTLSQLPDTEDKWVMAALGNTFIENFELDSLEVEADGGDTIVLTFEDKYKDQG